LINLLLLNWISDLSIIVTSVSLGFWCSVFKYFTQFLSLDLKIWLTF
jgi:hypothetical protein